MSSSNMSDEGAPPGPSYHVPALEKGLDILECLAAQGVPLTQAQIARAIGRGANELFRMLTTLERRGYIQRDPLTGAYGLTLRLFELSHTHSPLQGLLRAAAAPMRALSETTDGVSDLAVLVGRPTSRVQAALTVASLTRQRATFVDDTLPALQRCAEAIGQAAGIV